MDENSNNFNDLGLIPLPSNIEAIDLRFQLNEVLYLDYDKQDQSLKNIVKYFTKKSISFGFQIKDKKNDISSSICIKINKSFTNNKIFQYFQILLVSLLKKEYANIHSYITLK